MNREKVLFVCVKNSARSQIAEALLKKHGGNRFDVESAGLEPGTLNPLSIAAVKEIGIDISKNETRDVFELFKQGRFYSYVITVCDETSAERCPIFPAATKRLHWSFEDPAALKEGSYEHKLEKTREMRQLIEAKIKEFIRQVSLQTVHASRS